MAATEASDSTASTAQTRGERLGFWALFGIQTSLAVASVDAILALAAEPSGVASVGRLVAPFAVLAGVVAAGWIATVVAAEVAGLLRTQMAGEAAAIATAVIAGFGLLVLGDLNRVSVLRTEPARALLGVALIAGTALLVHAGARRLAAQMAWDAAAWLRASAIVSLTLLVALCVAILASPVLGPATRSTLGAGLAVVVVVWAVLVWLVLRLRAWAVALGMALALAGALAAQVWPAPSESEGRALAATQPTLRRVVLISIDTLRQDALSAYSENGADTPAIKALAEEALLFTRAYSAAPWTIPSFVSLMTGLPASSHQVNSDFAEIPAGLATLAERMRALGYRTAAIGHHPQLLNMARGFDDFDFTPRLLPYHPRMTGTKLLWRNARDTNGTDELPGAISRWLDDHEDEPFFLWAHFLDPHSPYNPPERFVPDHPLVAELGPQTEGVRMPGIRSGRQVRTPKEREWMRQLYAGEVRWVDESVGRILGDLRSRGLYRDSLIVLLSDHGEEFWEHGSFGHGHSLYEELVRVPLIVKLPGDGATGRVETPVSTAALGTTLLELAGGADNSGAAPESLRGFRPLLDGKPAAVDTHVLLGGVEYFEERGGVVSSEWKLIRGLHSGHEELYSLVKDPAETRSVAAEQPAVASRLGAVLEPSLSRLKGPGSEEKVELSPEVSDALKALGYIE